MRAAVRCAADDCQALEQLCRYITCPALVNEWVQRNAAGQVMLNSKTPRRDGTTHVVLERWSSCSGGLGFFHSQLCGCVFGPVDVAKGSAVGHFGNIDDRFSAGR